MGGADLKEGGGEIGRKGMGGWGERRIMLFCGKERRRMVYMDDI